MPTMNPTETYLHDQVQAISEAHDDPVMFATAMAAFVDEVAKAVGLMLAESASETEIGRFSFAFHGKLVEVRQYGIPQAVRIMPVAVAAAPPPPPEPESAVAAMATALALAKAALAPAPQQLALDPLATDFPYLSGDEIRRQRERRQLTQDAVGAELGVSGSLVGHWEKGRAVPRRCHYLSLRVVFNLPVDAW